MSETSMSVFFSALWLNSESNAGYGTLGIPNSRDYEITTLLTDWLTLDSESRKVAAEQLTESKRGTLLAYSERMASQAVRTKDLQCIFLGLLAVGIAGWAFERRDNDSILSLHHDAALRVNDGRPELVFQKAAALLPQRESLELVDFLRRPQEDKTIEAMGYVQSSDADGFRYQRTW
ncbi:MAG: hypothetical protein ACK5RJ_00810 [Burkholderiales bacterium]